ncbi:YtxH domain-containing protein [Chloroflexota bacterium]
MSNKNIAIGLALGLGVGTIIGLLYAPESGEEVRKVIRGKTDTITDSIGKLMFKLRWITMSPRERYLYHWNHGGSLRDWPDESKTAEPG